MANDQTSPSLASGTIIVAGLAVAGSLFFTHEVPLQGSRPVMSESQFHQSATSQDIEARLWQDPFAAIAKAIEKAEPGKSEHCGEYLGAATPTQLPSHCKPPLAERDSATLETTQVIGVTMPGAPYVEDGEVRRRTRYAVASSLERAGFVPEDEHHLGYFRPQENVRLPDVVPYEWFASSPADRQPTHHVLVLWLNEDALRDTPLHKLSSIVAILRQQKGSQSKRDVPVRIVGPYSSDILLDMAKEVETGNRPCLSPEKPSALGWRGHLEGVSFFTYAATVDDKELFREVRHCDTPEDSATHGYFENRGINLYRTVATDEVLARGIVNELKLRDIEPGKVERANAKTPPEKRSLGGEQHVALISEWDTFYGQTLPGTMERCFEDSHCLPKNDSGHSWVHKLTYLRGLDGQLPGTQGTEERKSGKGSGEADKQAGAMDFFKTQPDAKAADRPNGQGQQDYLRRLADHLQKIDDKLRQGNQGSLRAIGILGSDVFDKLLVLRALRPKFPQALFFTTDLDATLTMTSELSYTRNLIISSSFGPELRQEIQDEIPPFRGSYQAAAFLATGLAIRAPNNGREPDSRREQISGWLSQSQIFEIGRTGDVIQYSAGSADSPVVPPENSHQKSPAYMAENPPSQEGRSAASGKGTLGDIPPTAVVPPENRCDRELLDCSDIRPSAEDLFPRPQGLDLIAKTLSVSAFLVLLTLCIRPVRNYAAVEIALLGLALGAAAAACYFWERFAGWLTEKGNGEPVALLEGVSVWPTVLLRALSIVLCVYLIFRACRKVGANLETTADKMCLTMEPDTERRSISESQADFFLSFAGSDQAIRYHQCLERIRLSE